MKRGWLWPVAITGVLVTVVGVNVWVAVLANDDPSFAIEPDYYQKAITWDSSMAQARTNAALHWTISPELAPFTRDGAQLRVVVRDSAGVLIDDATITVTAIDNARASVLHAATLAHAASGGYTTLLPVDRAGEWELRFDVQRGAIRFTASTRLDAAASSP